MMLSSIAREAKRHLSRKLLPYLAAAIAIVLATYYLPNYSFLEKATADHTAVLLAALGLRVPTRVVNGDVFLANVRIVKECTGVQVIAVFCGLILPVPTAPWKKKLLTLMAVSMLLYVANVVRIALAFSLVYLQVLPWSLAHYPLSLLLGIIGVVILVLVADHLLPELGDFLLTGVRPQAAQTPCPA